MDIRSFFGDASAPSTSASRLSSSSSEDESDSVDTECRPPSPKKHCTAAGNTLRSGERIFLGNTVNYSIFWGNLIPKGVRDSGKGGRMPPPK